VGVACACLVERDDARNNVSRCHWWSAKSDASRATFRERVLRAVGNDPSFPLRYRRHHIGDEFAGWRRRIDAEVERDHGPALFARNV